MFSAEPLQPHTGAGARNDSESRGSRILPRSQSEGPSLQLVGGDEGEQDGEDGLEDHEGDGEGDRQGENSEHEMEQGEAQNSAPPAEQAEGVEQESDMELDLLAESESDSDENPNDPPIQRNAVEGSGEGGVGGSLSLFSEDDSEDSTQQEEEEDDDEDSDGNDTDERDVVQLPSNAPPPPVTSSSASAPPASTASGLSSVSGALPAEPPFSIVEDEPIFERRGPITPAPNQGTTTTTQRGVTPVSMQWAIRGRDPTGVRTGGLVFIDPASGTVRRSAATTAAAAIAAAATSTQDSVTMASTASGLARSFGIIIR